MPLLQTILMRSSRLRVLLTLAAMVLTGSQSPLFSQEVKRPNVLVIVADDLGYGDLGFQGGKDVPTPHLNELARTGTRCTSGYVSCPVCSPTRAGLLTGRYQQRFGHEFNPGQQQEVDAHEAFGLPTTEVTLANQLKQAGYKTAL